MVVKKKKYFSDGLLQILLKKVGCKLVSPAEGIRLTKSRIIHSSVDREVNQFCIN